MTLLDMLNYRMAQETEARFPAPASRIGNALVIAPHPDDESLACGGIIALLRKSGYTVHIVFITDGSASHPHSKTYPPDRLILLREEEARHALDLLGVAASHLYFLRLPDGRLQTQTAAALQKATSRLADIFFACRPDTLFLPWRRDPHPDHIASWQLGCSAMELLSLHHLSPPSVLEYLVWSWERMLPSELPDSSVAKLWKINIAAVLSQKKKAIAAHASQAGMLIRDDPHGFFLTPDMLQHFYQPHEFFLEYPGTISWS